MVAVTAQQQVKKEGPNSGIERTPAIDKIGDKNLKGHGAFAFRKSDTEFVTEFNKYLVPFLGTKEHLEITAKYDFTKEELPSKSTEELCKGE
jgi:polar amino acid transport system substrate-binding protein